jgi:hypothetical protein
VYKIEMLTSTNLPLLNNLTQEQKDFDISIAEKIMGWTVLDSSLTDSFKSHTLPESVYPFYETFSHNGVVTYHPTPYHSQVFSPSAFPNDDNAVFITHIANHSEQLQELLSTLSLIHHLRSIKEAGYHPRDNYYKVSKYYRPGDFSLAIWHSQKHMDGILEKVKEINQEFIGKYSIHTIQFNIDSAVVYCEHEYLIPEYIKDYCRARGMNVVIYERT